MKKTAGCFIAIVIVVFVVLGWLATKSFNGSEPVRIYVPHNADSGAFRDTLYNNLGKDCGRIVYAAWSLLGGDVPASYGSYVVNPGERAYKIANRIAKGRQTPVKVTVNVARTLDDLTNVIASRLEATPDEIKLAMDSVISGPRAIYTAEILPDTYELYWNDTPVHIVSTLVAYHDKFWNQERLDKAKKLGITPLDATILASIVEEESNKADEQPLIARLYLNRLAKGMKLQADPTVKFASGDFSLRRITGSYLQIDSPYNTYRVSGLPPGPIRVPQKATIDAVLDAPKHDYLYMCAKEDFSGYHNFSVDYDTHLKNARRYIAELNRRNITH